MFQNKMSQDTIKNKHISQKYKCFIIKFHKISQKSWGKKKKKTNKKQKKKQSENLIHTKYIKGNGVAINFRHFNPGLFFMR